MIFWSGLDISHSHESNLLSVLPRQLCHSLLSTGNLRQGKYLLLSDSFISHDFFRTNSFDWNFNFRTDSSGTKTLSDRFISALRTHSSQTFGLIPFSPRNVLPARQTTNFGSVAYIRLSLGTAIYKNKMRLPDISLCGYFFALQKGLWADSLVIE